MQRENSHRVRFYHPCIKKLSPTRFYNPISSYVCNEKLLSNSAQKHAAFHRVRDGFLVSDDKYGVVGADGEILSPSKYDYITIHS